MWKQRARLISTGLRFGDLAVLAAAFPLAYALRDNVLGLSRGGLYPIDTYLPLLASSLLGWQFASWGARLYRTDRTHSIMSEVWRLARALGLLAVVIAAAGFVLKQHDVSRLLVGLYFAIAFVLLGANRVVFRLSDRARLRRGTGRRHFAVVGTGDMAREVVEVVAFHPEWGYAFEGHILEDEAAEPPPGVPVLGKLADLGSILERHVLDEVIFGVDRERLMDLEEAVLRCEEQGVAARVALNFFPNRISRLTVEDLEGIPMLTFASAPSDLAPLLGKRVFDVVVSLVALTLFAPVLLLAAVAIKLDSPGPVLFRQRRMGLNGREFWLYKFRSMVKDAEARLPEVRRHNEMGGPAFKMKDDPRVTRVGRFLRRTSLDEFPQFINVLRGEMSVVGPRPPIPSEVTRYERWQRRRLSVKPGITCTWQVSGRNDVDFARWMELDLHYIDHWSLWHDLKIVLLTVPAVLFGRGAR